jgi:flagellar basal-body rod modification protein FlgD
MATDPISQISSITSQGTAASTSTKVDEDKNMFLKLMIAQIKNQDPLQPMDPTQYVSQLATFSQLEQQTETNKQLATVSSAVSAVMSRADLSYIGMDVESKLDIFAYKGNSTDFRYVTSGSDKVEIVISNDKGETIRTVEGSAESGEQEFTWDGRDDNGELVANGNYKIAIKAVDANGSAVQSVVSMRGIIKEVITENGVSVLVYENGTAVDSDMVVATRKPLIPDENTSG